ncbi:MAG: hypothetical protein J6K39_04265, partial [Clostridia bacterium]|nr:hypothetical protein [Clostridia bacterium]
MKKFKPILCVALMLAFGGLSLVGCGTTQTTITLDEAKTIIVNALAIEEPQAHALQIGANEAAEDEGNRNIFVKFGITSLSCKTDAYSGEALTRKLDQPCLLDKTGGTWNKYVINLTTIQNGKTTVDNEYYDGNMVYSYMNYGTPSYSKSEFEGTYSGVGKNRSQQLIIYDIMFSDKVFENCYSKEVIKTLTSSGFSLTMSMEYSKYIDLIYGELEAGMT